MGIVEMASLHGACPHWVDAQAMPEKWAKHVRPRTKVFLDGRVSQGIPIDLSRLSRRDAEMVISYVETCENLLRAVLTVSHHGPWDESAQLFNLPCNLLYRIAAHRGVVSVPLPEDVTHTGSWQDVCAHVRSLIGVCGYEGVCLSLPQPQGSDALSNDAADAMRAAGFDGLIVEAVVWRNGLRFFGTPLLP